MTALTALAWTVLLGCFAGLIVALHVGETCASNIGPYLAGGTFLSWVWLAYQHDKGDRQ